MTFEHSSYTLSPSVEVELGRPSKNPVVGLIGGVAESIVASSLDSKLGELMPPKQIAKVMSEEFEGIIRAEFRVDDSVHRAPSYLLETILDEYQLVSNPDGSFVKLKGITRLRHKQTDEVIWSNSLERYIVFNESNDGSSSRIGATVAGVSNAVSLLTEDDTKLKQDLKLTAQEIGEYLANSLVHDYEESRGN